MILPNWGFLALVLKETWWIGMSAGKWCLSRVNEVRLLIGAFLSFKDPDALRNQVFLTPGKESEVGKAIIVAGLLAARSKNSVSLGIAGLR